MGQVWQATDTQLNRQVALKILPDAFAADPDRLARFTREAQILASLNHPNIAAIYGIEEAPSTGSGQADTRALVLELVEGTTLADRIAKGPIPLDEALPIAKQIAEALEAAHEAGVIHRDLKPANIKVRDDGTVKVLDFGLAKALETTPTGDPSQSPTLTAAATQMGVIMGTAAYMSPEQAQGKPVDRRADVWAFGCCLYEALVGQRVFEADNVSLTLARVLTHEPELDRLPAATPGQVRRLLRRCLTKDAKDRPRDIADLRLEITEASSAPELAAAAVTAPRRRALLFPAAAVLGIVALVAWGLGGWFGSRGSPGSVPSVQAVLNTAPNEPIGIDPFQRSLTITPDGTSVIYGLGPSGVAGLYVRPLDRLEGHRLTGAESGGWPFVSPDGQWVGFVEQRSQLRKVPMLGGLPEVIADLPNFSMGASWEPDGTIILSVLERGLFRVSDAGGELEPLATPRTEAGEVSYLWPDPLPGGKAVLFSIQSLNRGQLQSQIAVLDLESGESKTLVPVGSFPHYLPSGHLVYNLNGTLMAVAFDAERLEVLGSPVPVLEGVSHKATGAVDFSVADDGSLVYATSSQARSQRSLVWIDRAGRTEALAAPSRNWRDPDISPDGNRLAVAAFDENQDVWIWDFERETLIRLTDDPTLDAAPLWHPNGREVVFASGRGEFNDLYRRRADGTGSAERVWANREGGAQGTHFSFTLDGMFVVRAPSRGGGLLLTSMEDGSAQTLIESEFVHRGAQISPDGRWLAYSSNESGQAEIYVRPFPAVDDGRFPVSTGGGINPRWSPDGSELFYRGGRVDSGESLGSMMVVQVETDPEFRAGRSRELFAWAFATDAGYAVDPNAERFLVVRIDAERGSESRVVLVQNWTQELLERVPVN